MYGESGNVSVVFTGATVSVDKKQTRHHPDAEYGPWLVEELENEQKIFAIIRDSQFTCPVCNTPLPPYFAASQTIECEIRYRDFDPFGLRITIPAIRCSACDKVCAVEVNGNERFNLYEAMVRAFDSEKIRP
jgi:transcription elongation factor Elf1